MGIGTGLTGKPKLKVLQMHRLLVFQEAFADYLAGKVTGNYVRERVKKMLECGLPMRLK